MNFKPIVSIIIPIYNQAGSIDKCLESIFNQTLKDYEVILVNDGSTDNLKQVLRSWETKIQIFHQDNQGAPSARNFGFKQSRGEYVIFCDADIVMKPNMLEQMYNTLKSKSAFAYAYSSFRFGLKKFKLFTFDETRLRKMPYIHTTSLIRRKYFPGFDTKLKKFQDWDLWLTMLSRGHKGIWVDKVLFSIKAKGTMSSWLPKFLYKLPWLKSVKKYKEAKKIIKAKHNL